MIRSVIAGIAAAWMLVLAGCSSDDASRRLNLFAWSEYVPREVVEGFTAETGIRVYYETFASNEEMLAKLLSGAQRYDIIQPSEYVVDALIRERKLLPLDAARLPGLANLADVYRQLGHDPGLKYSVPWMQGTVGIVVNTDRVREPVLRYEDVFQERYRGRIVLVDDAREIVSFALTTLGRSVNDVTPESLREVRPILEKWLPMVRVFDSDSPKTALLSGDVDLGIVWSGEAAVLFREDPKFRYVLPAAGAHRFIDSLAIPSNAPNPDGAHRFLEYILRPEVSRLVSKEFPYTNPNLAARKLLSPEELANAASYPPGDPALEIFRDIGGIAADIDKLVTDIKAGS